MARQSFSKSFSLNRNWIFIIGLVLLTVGLVFLFRQKKSLDSYIEKQKENIADFYVQNLEPLFSNERLTKEDIFNFAFYKELPMDRQNYQVLQLGNDKNGKEYFEFQKTAYIPGTNNLEQFAKLMELNAKQKYQLDSMLNSYRDKIRTQILVNDRNTLAINSNLWNLNKALMADLLMFAAKTNRNKFKSVFPEDFYMANEPSISKMVSEVNSFNNNKYIFVHSDTIFTKEFNFDKERSVKEEYSALQPEKNKDSRVRIRLDNDLVSAKGKGKFERNNFNIKIDSNYCRVQIPDIPERHLPDMNRINSELERAARQLKTLSFRFRTPVPPVPPDKAKGQRTPAVPESEEEFELNIDLPDVDSLVSAALSSSFMISNHIRASIDSINTVIKTDSMMTAEDKRQLKKEMLQLKNQLKQLKKAKKHTGAKVDQQDE